MQHICLIEYSNQNHNNKQEKNKTKRCRTIIGLLLFPPMYAMSSDLLLKEIIKQNEDLYSILGFDNNNNNDTNVDIKLNDIKKRYRNLALKYHPDKNIINTGNGDNNDLFHKISIAYEVLSNEQLRIKYDQWYQNNLINKLNRNNRRSEMINKLNENETKNILKVNQKNCYDLHDLQKIGQRLRKLKQLKLPYYNWDGKLISNNISSKNKNNRDNKDKWYDSSTIVFDLKYLQNNKIKKKSEIFDTINEEDLLSKLYVLLQLSEGDIIDHYFYDSESDSSKDKYDDIIFLHLIFSSPCISLKIWNKWRNDQIPKSINTQIIIDNVSPRLKEDFYNNKNSQFLNNKIELNSDIENLLSEPEILTETIIIN